MYDGFDCLVAVLGNPSKVLGQAEAMARLKRKRDQASVSTSTSDRDTQNLGKSPPPVTQVRASQFAAPRDRPASKCDISLPGDFLAAEGLGNSVFPAAERLLLPGPRERLKKQSPASILADSVQYQLQVIFLTLYCLSRGY